MKPTVVRTLLISLLLVVQLATVAIVVMGMRNKTTEQVAGNATASLSALPERVIERANRVTGPASQVLLTARELIGNGVLDARANNAVENFLLSQMWIHDGISRLQLVREDGGVVEVLRSDSNDQVTSRVITGQGISRQSLLTTYNASNERVRSWVNPNSPDDPRVTDWYQSARQAGELIWSKAGNLLPDGSSAVAAAAVVNFPDTSDAGVVSATVSTRSLALQLAGLPLGENGSLALVDATGGTIAQLGGAALALSLEGYETPKIERVAPDLLRDLFADRGIELVSETPLFLQAGIDTGVRRYQSGGQEMIGITQPVALANGQLPLLLAAAAPTVGFMGNLDELFGRKLRTLLAVILIPALIAMLALFGLNEPKSESSDDSATDLLTGFVKRAEFRRRLAGMLSNRRELEYGGRIVVVALDMDGFSRLHSRYGEETCDVVLKQFSRRLRSRVRQNDLIGRTGPDEFVLALRVDHGADVLTTVNRIRRATVIKPFVTASARHMLGVTAGIACVDPNETVDDLLARADQALVTGKARHRNRSYLAAAPDTTWPQTGVALPDDEEQTPDRRAPTLEI